MKLTIDIPEEYDNDFLEDHFRDFFSRVMADINNQGMCGRYEKEIAAMMRHAFKNAIVGDINLHSEVIPVANFSFNKDELRQIVKDEVKKIQSEEFVRRTLAKL